RAEKEAKKVKLHHHQHHHQHAEHRTHQPHQLQHNPNKPHNFSEDKHVLHSRQHGHHHHHQHHHHPHSHGLTNGTKKNLQPTLPPPSAQQQQQQQPSLPRPPPPPPQRKVAEQLQKKRAVPPEPPALFTFTPLKVVKAKPQDFKEKHREKDPKLKLKKENAEANVKHAALEKKKEPRPHNENIKSLTLEEYLLKKKKKKKKHREEEHSTKKVRRMHNKAVQTVCAGLGADLALPVRPDPSRSGTVKHESSHQPSRDSSTNHHQPYLHALKLGHVPFVSHQDHYIRSSSLQTGTWCGRLMHEERQAN
ncbi:hypothetical protein INR49_000052, partial [Caranx melampygus]